ncbi:MAG: hypothetical protein ACRCUT_07705 [Spirochaetota bacterium]
MELCTKCSNKEICSKRGASECEHYDVAFTRSEVISLIMNTDASKRENLKNAIARTYKVKMAF